MKKIFSANMQLLLDADGIENYYRYSLGQYFMLPFMEWPARYLPGTWPTSLPAQFENKHEQDKLQISLYDCLKNIFKVNQILK